MIYLRAVSYSRPDAASPYPHDLPAVTSISALPEGELKFTSPVTIFVGENGSGKSTLLEAIAVSMGFNPEGGSKNFNFSTRDSHSSLHRNLRPVKSFERASDGYFLRAESLYNLSTDIERLDDIPAYAPPIAMSYGGKSLHNQSHGEAFLSLIENRLGGHGLYLFDEPESALSPSRQLWLLRRMDELVRSDSQLIIATHSPIISGFPGADIIRFSEHGLEHIRWEETDACIITNRFLRNREGMLSQILGDTP